MSSKFWGRETIIIVILLIMIPLLSLVNSSFFTLRNILNILSQVSIIAVSAIGMTMIIVTGGIDVSAGSVIGLVCVATGSAAVAGVNPVLSLIIGILAGILLGAFNGAVISFFEIPPIIVTLGTMSLFRALVFQLLGQQWISNVPASISFFGSAEFLKIPVAVWLMIILGLVVTYFLKYKPFGRYIYAIGNDEETARLSGINTKNVTFWTYAIAGFFFAVSAVIMIGRTGIVQTNTGSGYELLIIAATVLGGTSILGGRGTVFGSILGALLITTLKNGMIMMNLPPLTEDLVIGVLILVSVLVDFLQRQTEVQVNG